MAHLCVLTAKDVIALIEDVLHNPNFNADDVNTDMMKRFTNSIDSGDLEIISMHQEGNGAQKLELFKRPAEKVLCELIWDMQLAGCQHFAFKEYFHPHGNRLFCRTFKWIFKFPAGTKSCWCRQSHHRVGADRKIFDH